MTDHLPDDDLTQLWKVQAEERPLMLSEIRSKATGFERQMRRRNLFEYGAAVIVVGAFSRLAWMGSHSLVRAGAGLIVLATVYVVYRIRTYASAAAMPEDVGLTTCQDFYRGELARHRRLLRTTWTWYLLPFVPGLLLLQIGRAAADPSRASEAAASALISVLIFLGIGWLNQRAARRLDRDIEALERTS